MRTHQGGRQAVKQGLSRQAAADDPVLPQVYASYRYRRDLADAAKIAGVFGRSRALKREEAEQREVSALTGSPSHPSGTSAHTCLSALLPYMPILDGLHRQPLLRVS